MPKPTTAPPAMSTTQAAGSYNARSARLIAFRGSARPVQAGHHQPCRGPARLVLLTDVSLSVRATARFTLHLVYGMQSLFTAGSLVRVRPSAIGSSRYPATGDAPGGYVPG
jgi:hypothetical protein